jgi:hypothetical protein
MPSRVPTFPPAWKLTALAVLTLLAVPACGAATRPHAAIARCSSFGVQAIRRQEVVRVRPAACAGLSREQVNEAVASAIREAAGPRPKAAARKQEARDGRFLAPLITTFAPPPAAVAGAGTSQPSGGTRLSLFAIACWLLTASAGGYLLVRTGALRRHPRRRPRGSLTVITACHVSAAVACLGTLAAFAVTGVHAVGWAAVGLVIATAGLGMGTLVTALPDPGPGQPAAPGRRQQSLVLVIAVHGVLATGTILLVWLAALGGL